MSNDEVIYEEKDDIAIIAINRPEKKNTLTNEVVQGIADGIDAASSSSDVSAVVLRGVGDTFTAGYDLTNQGRWDNPYGARQIDAREGAWDPVRDYQFMGNNVRRFMKIWECPKPVLGEVKGWAIGGATDLVLCCDMLFMASNAHIGYAPSRIYGTPTTMMWVYRLGLEHAKQFLLTGRAIDAETAYRIGLVSQIVGEDDLAETIEAEARRFRHIPANQLALNKMLINQAFENMGLRTTQMMGTFFDGVTRHTEEAYQWVEGFAEKGFRQVIRDRDGPWQDYGEKPKG
ncbi:MAG TPA: crotonase/enoyl-CoA hydratase family protein [Pseudomonadales bacterium]|jgi:enoyl-CoA hydratase|nr:enoyl-CoA hydratase [Gammaproteobacteria bacterium]MDP6024951.1 crotonase/enoyl-CoA hydratase family protein [Pseudomonadales bacterium]MDP7316341.1 crotonase/enoyl-CoA hydratase family protein [Pseudomonadales bacterium]MDP7575952.1 crotonase/enoyl-CoA hydratase family protein [Pseudomonadales bacterium]HJL61770.1 crotonase/enoyl-CoA hydratase family protein [Pseudomonadales bacterium]|tara:strand:- start:2750 stop:3613 length:864 start_codon:yes stop_codon:yes gene_type:complete